jgi:rSAM/selenodomain-associated transferase 1
MTKSKEPPYCHPELGSGSHTSGFSNKSRVTDPGGLNLDDRCLLFFVKYPETGKVKSRLASVIGNDLAAKLYRGLIMQMLSTLKTGDFPFYICFHPKNALKGLKEWLGNKHHYIPQKGKELGERMRNGFIEAFSMGHKRVVLIGSDIPDLPLEFIERAFTSLATKDVVIGPAYDGGYYLIGFKDRTFSPQIFEGIVWGTGNVFDETMQPLKKLGQKVHVLPYQRDIDTVDDLEISEKVQKSLITPIRNRLHR